MSNPSQEARFDQISGKIEMDDETFMENIRLAKQPYGKAMEEFWEFNRLIF